MKKSSVVTWLLHVLLTELEKQELRYLGPKKKLYLIYFNLK